MELGKKFADIFWHVRHPVESERMSRYRFQIRQNCPEGVKLWEEGKSSRELSRSYREAVDELQKIMSKDPASPVEH